MDKRVYPENVHGYVVLRTCSSNGRFFLPFVWHDRGGGGGGSGGGHGATLVVILFQFCFVLLF